MRAVVVALGKIGLPIAVQIARHGHEVVGCDVDPAVVELVNAAREPFPGEADLARGLAETVAEGRLRAVTDTTAAVAAGADLVIAVPPLVVDSSAQPDFGILDSVVDDIGAGLRAGTVVCVETTLPVGTTRNRVAPALARRSGLRAEHDFFAVHSPERVYAGRIFADLRTYPKIVGGVSPTGEQRAIELYRSFLDADVWGMGSAEAAELTKLVETTYRDVNIGLANEFARYADAIGVDIDSVIAAANSQPFSHVHRPGIAVGGHCIPVYPRFYLSGDPAAQLPAIARRVNEAMPAYAVSLLAQALDDAGAGGLAGARVLILGVTYRGDVKETAFSGAFAVRDALRDAGATVVASDPLYDDEELTALGFDAWDGGPVDGLILQADHAAYATITRDEIPGVRAVIDGRDVLRHPSWGDDAIVVRRIGRP